MGLEHVTALLEVGSYVEGVIAYIEEVGPSSYAAIEQLLQDYIDVEGQRPLELPETNIVLWVGSPFFISVLQQLHQVDKIALNHVDVSWYQQEGRLLHGIPQADNPPQDWYPEAHWMPAVIYSVDTHSPSPSE
jgi:hypothetical protein